MSEKKLNEKELEKVAGGNLDYYLPSNKGEHIPGEKAKSYIGEFVFVVEDADCTHFGWGKLIDSDIMKPYPYSPKVLHHVIDIQGRQGYGFQEIQYGQQAFTASEWTLFKQNPFDFE